MNRDFKTALWLIGAVAAVLGIVGVLAWVLGEKILAYFFFLLVGICLVVIGGLLVASANREKRLRGRY